MPIASLTALGSASGDVAGAVAAIVDYLEGHQSITAAIDAPALDSAALVGYYADTKTSESLGWWSGRGINGTQLTGTVDPAMLAQVLLGQHPNTGEQLVAAAGSAGRAVSRAPSNELLTVADVAEQMHVSKERVDRLAVAGARRADLIAAGEDPSSVSSWLTGHKHGRQWRFEPDEVERHAATWTWTRTTPLSNRAPSGELTVVDVAETLGVSSQRVRALAAAGTKRQELLDNGEDVGHIAQWLTGRKNAKQWLFDPTEIARAADTRTVPRVVVAYDFTLSVEKSISLTWVHADAEQRAVVEEALRHGVQAGVSHLEDHGLAVRRSRGANTADGMWAASYLHLTNRNLEPQLHVHTVIVNVAADASTGHTQTIDGRGLFREVTAAGYLAGAEIRAHLADQLGLTWDRPHKGTMEVAGVPDTAITATSTRRAEVVALADELGYASAKARQVAALSTRAPKQHPEDFDALVESWQALLAAHGFGPADAAAILHSNPIRSGVEAETLARTDAATERVGPDHAATGQAVASIVAATSPGPDAATAYRRHAQRPGAPGSVPGLDAGQTADLFVWLGSPAGLTRSSGVFSRSDIVEAVVTWDADHGGGTRLRAATIQDIADRVMGGAGIGSRFDDHVLPITVPAHLAQRSAGRQWLTTESMLAIETAVIDAYRDGRGAVTGIGPDHVQQSINRWGDSTGNRLGADQAAMIATVTTGADRFALVVGPAGTGKTAALEVACRAWEHAGLIPVGLAVTGSATDTLAASTGIDTSTVASILARDTTGLGSGFRPNTVVVVDEASMLSNRDHHRLVQLVVDANCRMVAVGDPAQHGAVEAGGLWAHLLTTDQATVATLEVNRRQSGRHMTDVRLANDAIRSGEIAAAFERLATGDRIVTAPTSGELLDRLAADWYVDLLTQRADPSVRPSSMMAENHTVRRELTIRAQTLLRADDTLTGDPLRIGESQFHVGDRVITRTQHTQLRFADRTKLRNGATGTVTELHPADDGRHELTVAFDNKGTVRLDHNYLTAEVRPGLNGGLVPAYAITTHVAQGQTMTAGRTIGTDASSRQAIYVGLSRGTDDARVYVVDRTALAARETADVGLPAIADTRTITERLEASIARTPLSEVATAIDPNAQHVGTAARRPLADLHAAAPHDQTAKTALDINAHRAARTALINPPIELVELAGPRPPATNPNRPQWDRAITTTVSYWAAHLPDQPFNAVLDPAAAANHDPVRYLRARTQLDAATRNHAAILPTADLALRTATRENIGRVAATVLDARARNAATNPAAYVTELIGLPPTPGTPEALRHQRATEAIETWRHRRGLDPTDHWPTETTARQHAIGPKPDDPELVKPWAAASNAIDRTIADMTSRAAVRRRNPNAAPQHTESSLPPLPQQTVLGRRIR